MTFEMLILLVTSLVLSLVLAYACWIKVRVVCLQERLFAIRDSLFDDARIMGCLADTAYRYHRNVFNALIRLAPTFSVPTLLWLMLQASKENEEVIPQSSNAKLQESIDKAASKVSFELLDYVFRHTITGRICMVTTKLVGEVSRTFVGIVTYRVSRIPSHIIS